MQGLIANVSPVPAAEVRAVAEEHGYESLGPLTSPSLGDDPHHVRCVYCQRLSAERLGDIEWGCSCQVNASRARQTSRDPKDKQKSLLKDSGLPVLAWWDPSQNLAHLWDTTVVRARREVGWKCPDCGTLFTARVLDMVNQPECPECAPKRRAEAEAEYERLARTPVTDIAELWLAWDDEADPTTVMVAGSQQLRRFRCPEGHLPRISPFSYLHNGCPSCRGQRTLADRLAAAADPDAAPSLGPEIASQWHPTLNDGIDIRTVSPGSRRRLWWRDPLCGHEWQASPAERDYRQRLRCPQCRTILDSLGWHYPELAAEWSPDNPVSAWHVRPTGQKAFLPQWVCSNDANHTWEAPLASRASGAGCPECRVVGKSNVEIEHHEAAVGVFGKAGSGRTLRSPAFTRGGRWVVDIVAELPEGQPLAIEYDGAYWHSGKAPTDSAKSLDLLDAGYLVARLREHPLPSLALENPRYAEFTVYSTAPDPASTLERVRRWAESVARSQVPGA